MFLGVRSMVSKNCSILFITMLLLPCIAGCMTATVSSESPSTQVIYFEADVGDFMRGPTVNLVTNNSALIFWRTTGMTDAEVQYGLNVSLLDSVQNATLDTDHRVTLEGLSTGQTYYYKVLSNGAESDVYHFKTAPADGETFKLIVFGDNRPDQSTTPVQPAEFEQIVDLIASEEPHLVVMTGDYVYRVATSDTDNVDTWGRFTQITDRIGHYAPVYAVIGNHETGAATGSRLLQYFFDAFEQFDEPSGYFSFDYAGVHFTILDSEELGIEGRIIGDQYDWLVEDLSSSQADMKFVAAHRPLYPVNHIGTSLDVNITERDRLQSLFEDQNVTTFFAGHDHAFNRLTVNGVVNIITGGAGAPLVATPWGGAYHHYLVVDVSPNSINFTVKGTSGETKTGYKLPYEGPIEISLRGFANQSTEHAETIPEIYFSEVPTQQYYSWDSESNTTALSGFPTAPGVHSLDVYAQNEDGIWSHEHYVFTTRETTPEQTNGPDLLGYDPLLVMGLLAGSGVAVVIVLVLIVKRRS